MTKPEAVRTFLLSEVEGLEPFDLILIAAAVGGATVETLKTICDAIIVGRKPGWMQPGQP